MLGHPFPIIPADVLEAFEFPDAIVDALVPSPWMSTPDALVRAIGPADDYDTDGMGAGVWLEPITSELRYLLVLATLVYDTDTYRRCGSDREFSSVPDAWPGDVLCCRWDDRGFYDAIPTDRETAERWRGEWVAANASDDEDY